MPDEVESTGPPWLDDEDDEGLAPYDIAAIPAEDLTARLDAVVIGQLHAKRTLSHAVAMHTWRGASLDTVRCPNALLIGPTGCGKTLSASTLADTCGVPFVNCEAASLVPPGIVGFKLEHIAELLFNAAKAILSQQGARRDDDDIIRLAERGVVFLDEFDKLADREAHLGESQRARVQKTLLRFVEGTATPIGETNLYTFSKRKSTLKTENLLIIAAGAFAEIEGVRTQRRNSDVYVQMFGTADKVVAEDVKNYGFLPELVGRFEVIVRFDELTTEELVRVLRDSPNSPLPSLVAYTKSCGIALELEPDAFTAIAARAATLGVGARGLQQLLFPLVTERIEAAKAAGEQQVRITSQDFERKSDLW